MKEKKLLQQLNVVTASFTVSKKGRYSSCNSQKSCYDLSKLFSQILHPQILQSIANKTQDQQMHHLFGQQNANGNLQTLHWEPYLPSRFFAQC